MDVFGGQTWDHNKLVFEINRDLHEILGITGAWPVGIFGFLVTAAFFAVDGFAVHKLMILTEFSRKILNRMTAVQYLTMQILLIVMISCREDDRAAVFRVKYVWVTPWFNI